VRRLLSPLAVRSRVLKNRVIMGSMHTRLESLPNGLARQIAFYAERARNGVALIVTGGYAPNQEGRLEDGAPILETTDGARALIPLVESIHEHGSLVLLQILHAGRYARHDGVVGASSRVSPINPRAPRALTPDEVERTIEDYVRCAELASVAGFDGVEIMGSEGYLINQFTVRRTNDRNDEWGGDAERLRRFPIEIVRRTRARLPRDFLIMYRISALDLVEEGNDAAEIALQARAIEAAGADILNTGIGWHEARIPTVAYFVPRAAWLDATARLKAEVRIPVVASNRINMPDIAEAVLAEGKADLVSLARPFLADAAFVRKIAEGREDEINTCIACNQACLDFIFRDRPASCLVNPRAGRELDFDAIAPARAKRRIAVVGAGAGGLAFSTTAAERGHDVHLFEAEPRIGGQLNYASEVPGKSEFNELKRYFARRLELTNVALRLDTRVSTAAIGNDFDRIVIATGVVPRRPDISGIDHPKVVTYPDILSGRVRAGRRVAIIGAGGIGFDVAAFLLHGADGIDATARFMAEWGVDVSSARAGGLVAECAPASGREVYLLQRSKGRFGRALGVTTGWILRSAVHRAGIKSIAGCIYLGIDDAGLHLDVAGSRRVLDVDTIVVCAGQESNRSLYDDLKKAGREVDIIGGADVAAELDAMRAIDQGVRLAMTV
jgi:2,4-dienoyl-CoA reductase (NADPH2)